MTQTGDNFLPSGINEINMTPKQKLFAGIGAGVLLVGGAVASIYYLNKDKSEKGAGDEGGAVSPCASKPDSIECKKEKCSAVLATSGRAGSNYTQAQIDECKKLLNTPVVGGVRGSAAQATQGRGFDGIQFA